MESDRQVGVQPTQPALKRQHRCVAALGNHGLKPVRKVRPLLRIAGVKVPHLNACRPRRFDGPQQIDEDLGGGLIATTGADPRRAAELQPNELKSIAADLAAGDFRGASVALGVLAGRGPALAQVVERVHPILRQRVTHTTGGGLSLAAASAGQGDVSLVDSAGDLNLLDAD